MARITVIPELETNKSSQDLLAFQKQLLAQSGLHQFTDDIRVWTSSASNQALSYSTHGIMRYFGKFPPPIARYLIKTYSEEGDLVIDPTCGSGTTALESLLLGRNSICMDINPLSILVSKVKVTRIPEADFNKWLDKLLAFLRSGRSKSQQELVGLRNSDHWFLRETLHSLGRIKHAIYSIKAPKHVEDALLVTLLGIVRRVSRATTQQGRLFLDVQTAVEDTLPVYIRKARKNTECIGGLPNTGFEPVIKQASVLNPSTLPKNKKAKLLICHPPYFNNYKYSGVYSLELAWMGHDHAGIRAQEIRESFKVGKPERLDDYIEDMVETLTNCQRLLEPGGVVGLMIGDTVLRNTYIPVTQSLLQRIHAIFAVESVALRVPRFTEASWAASQRRFGDRVGVSLSDFVIVLRHKS